MISLHSCFVAGLTLIYCIWRDRTLFSYEVIEAAQSCSQILTIFGEKWPGAIKYRDIFDALSQSLFKLTMKPAEATAPPHHTRSSPSLQLNIDTQSFTAAAGQTVNTLRGSGTPVSPKIESSQPGKPSMSHLVTDAVKEAFMEVDEEAPGGWQGWRMWNDMVTNDNGSDNSTSRPAFGFGGGVNPESIETGWTAYPGSGGIYGIDPVQDAAMQMGDAFVPDHGEWGLSGYR